MYGSLDILAVGELVVDAGELFKVEISLACLATSAVADKELRGGSRSTLIARVPSFVIGDLQCYHYRFRQH